MDREKVIKAMEHCIGDNCNGDKWSECEYSGHGCIDALLGDAIALLKAQEPKPPIIIKENSYGWKFYYCPQCGKELYQNNKFDFCEKCGQAVM